MSTIQRTKEILAEAEKALASLASEAAKGTEYDKASCLIDVARELNSLAARTLQKLDSSSNQKVLGEFGIRTDGMGKSLATEVSSGIRAKVKKNKYPAFLRQGDDLVKIGWSPSEKTEYEHKSPKRVLPLLASAIAKTGANGRRFTMDRIIPLLDPDPAHGRRIPDYQVYLCLAWFRDLGFVIQHGRQGYSLASKAPMEPLLEAHWANLPVR